jgi:iron-sulfur cluster assembly protein
MTMPETTPQPVPQGLPVGGDAQLITLTDAAAAKVVELRSREGKSDAALRLFVKSGGCSGFSYGLAFDDRIAEDDRLESHGDVRIVIDAFSVQYVDGAEIDYVDSLMGSGFAINNPNAVSSCACGSSFNTDGSPASGGGCAHSTTDPRLNPRGPGIAGAFWFGHRLSTARRLAGAARPAVPLPSGIQFLREPDDA